MKFLVGWKDPTTGEIDPKTNEIVEAGDLASAKKAFLAQYVPYLQSRYSDVRLKDVYEFMPKIRGKQIYPPIKKIGRKKEKEA